MHQQVSVRRDNGQGVETCVMDQSATKRAAHIGEGHREKAGQHRKGADRAEWFSQQCLPLADPYVACSGVVGLRRSGSVGRVLGNASQGSSRRPHQQRTRVAQVRSDPPAVPMAHGGTTAQDHRPLLGGYHSIAKISDHLEISCSYRCVIYLSFSRNRCSSAAPRNDRRRGRS